MYTTTFGSRYTIILHRYFSNVIDLLFQFIVIIAFIMKKKWICDILNSDGNAATVAATVLCT